MPLKSSIAPCSLLAQISSLSVNGCWMKIFKPIDPPPVMVFSPILGHRDETAALTRLQTADA